MSDPVEQSGGGRPQPVETLQETLRRLLRERETLRSSGADPGELERNRRAIVDVQWELSHSLIARHHVPFQAA